MSQSSHTGRIPGQIGLRQVAQRLRSGRFRSSVALFLGLLITSIALSPLFQESTAGLLIETALTTIVFGSAALAVGARRSSLVIAVVLAVPAIVGRWLHYLDLGVFPPLLHMVCAFLFVAFVAVQLLLFILRASQVDGEVLCAAIGTYVLLAVIWSLAYGIVVSLDPRAFAFSTPGASSDGMGTFESLYFSAVTLTTIGYGDIVPVSRAARTLAMMEGMTGVLYVAMLMARLVTLYAGRRPASSGHA